MAGVSIVFVTHRPEPRFDWFVDSLARQLEGDSPEVIFVDGLHSPERSAQLERAVRGRLDYRHVPPKPTPWNGPHRLTSVDYFAGSSVRNTGIIYARNPYVWFHDDCSVLLPGWWREVRAAAEAGSVMAGAYHDHRELAVEDGVLASSRLSPGGADSRWDWCAPGDLVRAEGGQLYGGSFGVPRELLLDVNGLDELCDPIGYEDCHLGIRLEWAGAPILYNRRLQSIKSRERHEGGTVVRRLDKAVSHAAYWARLTELGLKRQFERNADSSQMVLELLYGTRQIWSMWNYYELAALTEDNLLETVEQFPREHWFDGQPLSEL